MAQQQTKSRLFAMLSEPIADQNRTNPPENRTNPSEDAENTTSTYNDTLFPAPPPVVAPTSNLTAVQLRERAAAPHARFVQAAREWDVRSAEADAMSARLKALGERIGKGTAWCEAKAREVDALRGQPQAVAQMVAAEAELGDGRKLLATLHEEADHLAAQIGEREQVMDRMAIEMGDAEDTMRRAMGGPKGFCCPRCHGWVVDGVAHQECRR